MFKSKKEIIIAQNEKKYLSFPDIIKSPKADNRFFLVYREGDDHHPTWSKLVLLISEDGGDTWDTKHKFPLTIKKDNYVWNCPRLSYVNNVLYIICDQKNSTFERTSTFKTVFLTSATEGNFFKLKETPLPGMVPDKIIEFKNKLFCANHKIKSPKNDLIQLVSWSRDKGENWYDTNIVAHDPKKQFCEASVVDMGDYLIAYLRDNSGHMRHIYTTRTEDGINWSKPSRIEIFGQRVTALRDEKQIIGAYRDTNVADRHKEDSRVHISVFEHDAETNKINVSNIDPEYVQNQYHFGYTGMAKKDKNSYLLTYYIKQN